MWTVRGAASDPAARTATCPGVGDRWPSGLKTSKSAAPGGASARTSTSAVMDPLSITRAPRTRMPAERTTTRAPGSKPEPRISRLCPREPRTRRAGLTVRICGGGRRMVSVSGTSVTTPPGSNTPRTRTREVPADAAGEASRVNRTGAKPGAEVVCGPLAATPGGRPSTE